MATRFAQSSSFVSKPITYGAKATPRTISQAGRRLDGTECHFPHLFSFFLLHFADVFYDRTARTGPSYQFYHNIGNRQVFLIIQGFSDAGKEMP